MKKHTLEDLPVEVELDLDSGNSAASGFLLLLSIIGIGLILVGGYFIIWGPERVSYSLPDIEFFFKAYPGPIATIGFVLIAASNAIRNQLEQKRLLKVDEQLSSQLSFSEEDIPEGKLLNILPIDSGRFRVELTEAPEQSTESVPVDKDPEPVVKK